MFVVVKLIAGSWTACTLCRRCKSGINRATKYRLDDGRYRPAIANLELASHGVVMFGSTDVGQRVYMHAARGRSRSPGLYR